MKTGFVFFIFFTLILVVQASDAQRKNGFDLSSTLIPVDEILPGGPPRDGIPAIHDPQFLEAHATDYLDDADRVLGIDINGQARAYPIRILNWHEVVNDHIGDVGFSITYCPLCGTGVAFKGSTASWSVKLGVSGLLYNSDVLLYDLETESLWSQILGKSISGPMMGETLIKLPLSHTTWRHWRDMHPQTQVLSTSTGHQRDYARDPYEGYISLKNMYFPVSSPAPETYHPKEQVIGLEHDAATIAFPFIELNRHAKSIITGELNGLDYRLVWNKAHQSADVYDSHDRHIPVIQAFWFAWYTFHPETEIFQPNSP